MSTENESTNRVRTSDAERERVAETLRNAVTEGRLTLEEGDQRLTALYTTKYRDELPPLLAELPTEEPARGPQGSGWGDSGRGPGRRGAHGHGPGPDRDHPRPWGPGRGWRGRTFGRARFGPIIILLVVLAITGHLFWGLIPLFVLLAVVRFNVGHCIWHHRAAMHAHHDDYAGRDS